MKSLFSYDNPVMQALMYIGDLIILNILFILCCLPVFTIGAAQSGLYNAVRVMQDKEDDSSCAAAFFRGFTNGFKRITIVWLAFLVIFTLLSYNCICVYLFESLGFGAATVFAIIGLCLCAILYTSMSLFHSRFDCTVKQLFRNGLLLILAHPLRITVAAALSLSFPLLIVLDFYTFTIMAPVFLALWFSTAALFGYTCVKKPFQELADGFQERQKQTAAQPLPEAETENQEETPVL